MLTHTALHGVGIMAADIRNAYLQALLSENHFIVYGEDLGIENVGKWALVTITRALYGSKVTGRDFWHYLRSCIKHMNFELSLADPDILILEAK